MKSRIARRLLAALLGALVATPLAIGVAHATSTGGVSGIVWDGTTFAGAANVCVSASGTAGSGSATTDASGNYSVALPAGSYSVTFRSCAGAPIQYVSYTTSPPVTVTAGYFPVDVFLSRASGSTTTTSTTPTTAAPTTTVAAPTTTITAPTTTTSSTTSSSTTSTSTTSTSTTSTSTTSTSTTSTSTSTTTTSTTTTVPGNSANDPKPLAPYSATAAGNTVLAYSGVSQAVGTGTGTVTVGKYNADPYKAAPGSPTAVLRPVYFDVKVSNGSSFGSIVVTECDVDSTFNLYWYNGSGWSIVRPTTYSSNHCLNASLDGSSSPTTSQLTGTVFAAAVMGSNLPTTRLAGTTREGTAIAVSQASFKNGSAKAVVLARSDDYPDALAGGPLAAHVGGPLLLTAPARLDTAVLTEIKRVLPAGGTVYLLGGPAAVSPNVAVPLSGAGYAINRIAGDNRFSTSVAIANVMGAPTQIFEVTGTGFADAVSAVPPAILVGGAILLTDGSNQSDATASYLAAHPPTAAYAVGGPAAAADPSAQALVGSDRWSTAAIVATHFFPSASVVGIATGTAFPDALAAGAGLGATGPLLLVPPSGPLAAAITVYLGSVATQVKQLRVFGGTQAVGSDVVTEVSGASAS